MNNPIKSLSRREWALWLASLAVVLIANLMTPELDPLTVTAALVGVTSLVFAAKGKIMLHLITQHKLRVLQRPVVQQPIQLCPLCRGVAIFVLDGDAVNGKDGAILEPGFHPVGIHVIVAGNQFVHKKASMFFTFASFAVESSGCPFADL